MFRSYPCFRHHPRLPFPRLSPVPAAPSPDPRSPSRTPSNLPAGDGYTILLTNTLNSTDVYATSEPFRIAPQGSLYPTDSSSSASGTASGTASRTASGSASGSASASASGSSRAPASAAGRSVVVGGAGAVLAALGVAALL